MKIFNSHYGELKGDRKYWSSLFGEMHNYICLNARNLAKLHKFWTFLVICDSPTVNPDTKLVTHYVPILTFVNLHQIETELKCQTWKTGDHLKRVLRYSTEIQCNFWFLCSDEDVLNDWIFHLNSFVNWNLKKHSSR